MLQLRSWIEKAGRLVLVFSDCPRTFAMDLTNLYAQVGFSVSNHVGHILGWASG